MQQIATITSKRQLTIPAEIFRRLGLKKGHKVVVALEDNIIKITPTLELVGKLAGSVNIPEKYKNVSLKQLVEKAKQDYFKNKKTVG